MLLAYSLGYYLLMIVALLGALGLFWYVKNKQ